MNTHTRSRLASACFAVALCFNMGMGCNNTPVLHVDSPVNGTFSNASSVIVTGRVEKAVNTNSTLTVNGVPVTIQPDLTWTTTVNLDPVAIVNPILVRLERPPKIVRQRVTVIAGDSIVDGDFSLEAMSMRLTAGGLDAMEPILGGLFALDPGTLVPVGTVLDSSCQIPGPFGTCLGSATTSVSNPTPTISNFAIDMSPMVDEIDGTISIFDLQIHLDIDGTGLVPNCGLRLDAAVTTLPGTYAVEPDPVNPSGVDVQQNSISVSFTGFNQTFTSGLCDVPIIGDIIQAIIGDLAPTVTQGFQTFLSDPDGSGPLDAPVAEAIEMATVGLDLDGSIGSQIGVNLEAPHFLLAEDINGLTIGTDARITAATPDPTAPDLLGSYHVNQVFPNYPVLTPVGGLSYDLGLCIGTSAFNQLLKAEVESGLLRQVLTELDLGFGSGPQPITAGLLALFIPELANADPNLPLELHVLPELAPFTTGLAGPAGELATLHLPSLRIKLVEPAAAGPLVEVIVDATTGLDFGFANGQIAVTIGGVAPGSLNVDIVDNRLATNETVLAGVLGFALDQTLPSLADSFGGFPLPDLLGLQLNFVEASKNGEFISVFLDLSQGP